MAPDSSFPVHARHLAPRITLRFQRFGLSAFRHLVWNARRIVNTGGPFCEERNSLLIAVFCAAGGLRPITKRAGTPDRGPESSR
jgi:hypothetical protein